jgi:ABC-2 type transport system permease protein
MAGGFLAIGSCISALTKSQVIAFVISAVICILFYVSGLPMVLNFFTGWAPQTIINAVAALSVLTHFDSIQKGIIDMRDIFYFAVLISFWLFANVITINSKKAD